MSLHGALSTMPLSELLQWLSDARKTGILNVSLESDERILRFDHGQVVALGTDDPLQRELGRMLLVRGLISEKILAHALDLRSRSTGQLGEVLVGEGIVAQGLLDEVVLDHARETILGMLVWEEGRFVFGAQASSTIGSLVPAEYVLPRPLVTRELLMEGVRRADEWARLTDLLPSEYVRVSALVDDHRYPVVEHLWKGGAPVALGELVLARPESRYEVYQQLFEAHTRGLVAIETESEEVGTASPRAPVDTLVETARELLQEQQFEEATRLLRAAESLDVYRADVRELLHRVHVDHVAALYRRLPPHRVPLVTGAGRAAPSLTPAERHLMSRINGGRDICTLAVMTELGELRALKLLARLLQSQFIRFV